jgi:hypothetical protein
VLVYQRVRDKSSLQMASVHEYAIAMLKKIGGYWSFGNEYPEMVQQF